ncbi:MAG: hypothetical protein JWO02_1705 [Solirubrobacterales bacterium]|nr:hypothetical protein [Solirubrobacterales bacterium]
MTDDDGHAIAYHALKRGTPVRSSDGIVVGKVRRVSIAVRENIFDGIDVDTHDGLRFVDAPEVHRIYERAVELTITADDVNALPRPGGGVGERMKLSKTARRAQRLSRNLKDRWERR